jgi:hypothetical protein
MGQWQVLPHRNIDGRFTSESSRNSDKVALTLSAKALNRFAIAARCGSS